MESQLKLESTGSQLGTAHRCVLQTQGSKSLKIIVSILCFSLLSGWHSITQASLAIPSNLTQGDQETLLNVLGIGTSFRQISDPYPLGGFDGIEMGVSYETLPTEDISRLGNRTPLEKNVSFSRVSIAKGLFNNIDLLFSFLPYTESIGMGIYGGALRWGFFKATFLPATFSLLGHAANTNVGNLVFSQSLGVDLLMILSLEPFSFYGGGGLAYAQGQFSKNITQSGMVETRLVQSIHSVFGISVKLSSFFAALELDNYNVAVVGGKVGLRF